MRAILIDPFEKTITEVDHPDDYKDIYTKLGEGVDDFNIVNIDDSETIFVDGEGLFKDDQKFFGVKGYHQPLAGRGLILGTNEGGDSIATALTIDQVRDMVEWLSVRCAGFRPLSRSEKGIIAANAAFPVSIDNVIGEVPVFESTEEKEEK